MPKGNVKRLEKELLFSKTKVRIKINLDRRSNNSAANNSAAKLSANQYANPRVFIFVFLWKEKKQK